MRFKNYSPFLLSLLCSFALTPLKAQITVDAQYRNRGELRSGFQHLPLEGTSPALFITQRTRLSLKYQTEDLKIVFTPQDVRIWGDEQLESSTGVFGDAASLDLHEGYFELNAGPTCKLSIGRQELNYDNQRLMGNRNWNQTGLSYDALVAKIQLKSYQIHVAGSWNASVEALYDNLYPANRIKALNFIWLNKAINKRLNASLLYIATGKTATDTTNHLRFRHTLGVYSKYDSNQFNAWANAYYQFGKNQTDRPIQAFLIDANASYTIGKWTTGLTFSYLSGNAKTGANQTKDQLFDVLYGARHRYFGAMDYFRNFADHTKQGGLIDYNFYLFFVPIKGFSVNNSSHYFQLAKTNALTPDDRNLGFENDLIIQYKFSSWGTLEGGFAFLLPSQTLKTMQKTVTEKFSHFCYIQITVSPTIFSQKSIL